MNPASGPNDPNDAARPRDMVAALAPVVVTVVVVFGLAGLALIAVMDRPGMPVATVISSPAAVPISTATVPAADAERVHVALHDVGTWCRTAPGSRTQDKLEGDLDVILSFSRSYPDATFSIDGETGRSVTLLMTTRQLLRTCEPAAAARADAALPTEFQDTRSGKTPPSDRGSTR